MRDKTKEKSIIQILKNWGVVISLPLVIGVGSFLFIQQINVKNAEIDRMKIFQVDNPDQFNKITNSSSKA